MCSPRRVGQVRKCHTSDAASRNKPSSARTHRHVMHMYKRCVNAKTVRWRHVRMRGVWEYWSATGAPTDWKMSCQDRSQMFVNLKGSCAPLDHCAQGACVRVSALTRTLTHRTTESQPQRRSPPLVLSESAWRFPCPRCHPVRCPSRSMCRWRHSHSVHTPSCQPLIFKNKKCLLFRLFIVFFAFQTFYRFFGGKKAHSRLIFLIFAVKSVEAGRAKEHTQQL